MILCGVREPSKIWGGRRGTRKERRGGGASKRWALSLLGDGYVWEKADK